jgi:hypothetical protein
MNDQLKNFARETLINNLATLPDAWQIMFKRMYGRNNGQRSLEDTMVMNIAEIVAEIPPDRLDWAMKQVDASIRKLTLQEC